jgi:hypothetical protein
MAINSIRRLAVAAALSLAIAAVPATALAGSDPAPGTGFAGACNMLAAVGVGAQGGMVHAMEVDNPNGNDGMWRAVDVSGCS